MEAQEAISGYNYRNADLNESHSYLLPRLERILTSKGNVKDIFEVGCGNGAVARRLTTLGYSVTGIDPSVSGIERAHETYPSLSLHIGSAYDDLRARYGQFDAVVSLEVVEHVYNPRKYASAVFNLVRDGGVAIISTPYHGYLKNVALAVSGKLDAHFTALWDHGHIKFWSMSTLTTLLEEAGFRSVEYHRVGRVPAFAKSMIAIAYK